MVMPYLGSSRWYRLWLSSDATQPLGHDLTRSCISPGRMLTVPVEGGYRLVRKCRSEADLQALTLSDHAGWQHVHLGALQALYAGTPYFYHYFPKIEAVIAKAYKGQPLADFTFELHRIIMAPIAPSIHKLRELQMKDNALFLSLKRERMDYAPDNISVLNALFNLGPEMPFTLL